MKNNITLSLEAVRAIAGGHGTDMIVDFMLPGKIQELGAQVASKNKAGMAEVFGELAALMQIVTEANSVEQPVQPSQSEQPAVGVESTPASTVVTEQAGYPVPPTTVPEPMNYVAPAPVTGYEQAGYTAQPGEAYGYGEAPAYQQSTPTYNG